MLTGRSNYEKSQIALTPEEANEPDISWVITVSRMTDGSFTGVGFDKYINDRKCDYYNARRIINGTDKAGLIAGYAEQWHDQDNRYLRMPLARLLHQYHLNLKAAFDPGRILNKGVFYPDL